ncbi:MAG: c-type cytochrome [Chitinophagaceae bacterium]
MKKADFIWMFGLASLVGIFSSCHAGKNNPGTIYMPDMYYSRAYDAYTPNPNFADGQTSRMPVPGTIKRGALLPFHLPFTDSGYAVSGLVKCPIPLSPADLKEGKRLFDIYCAICHGPNLDGQGPIAANGKFPAAPANFKLPAYLNMPVGTMFFDATYGKNMMGSYASQLNQRQRWMVVSYIKSFQLKNGAVASKEDSVIHAMETTYQTAQMAATGK